MTPTNTERALKEAEALVVALKACNDTISIDEHQELLRRTNKIRSSLERPYDIANRWLDCVSVVGALWTLLRTETLQKLPLDGGKITAAELATAVRIDVSAITRMMRMAIVNGIVEETEPNVYKHNDLSRAFQIEAMGSFLLLTADTTRTWLHLPDYFKSHKVEDLYDPRKTPYVYAADKEGLTSFELLNEDIEWRNVLNNALRRMGENMPMLGMFPFSSLKDQVEQESERAFFVDIAGGKGQAMLKVQTECPGGFGAKMILQDLPIVIHSLKSEEIPGIEATVHDIFTPQPVKNAHIYFLRRVLHDYYIPDCTRILANVVTAMGPDSRLIICDLLIPEKVDVGVSTNLYWLDFAMLVFGGKEKTLEEFENMFEEVGLELVEVYHAKSGNGTMLETRLKR